LPLQAFLGEPRVELIRHWAWYHETIRKST